MTELELIIDLHRDLDRQGPGSEKDTLRALGFIDLPAGGPLKVADIGCGSGSQTLTLAKALDGHITAADLFPEFLDMLQNRARRAGLQDRISTLAAPMEELPFEREALDIIWAEGAVYNMGFENGLKNWRRFLKKGGYLAVSEITWTTLHRPWELETYWKGEYPEIDLASNKIRLLEANGYSLAGYFCLGRDSWTENYYNPLQAAFGPFLEKHGHSGAAKKVVGESRAEIELYEKYNEHYSYGFYIAQKN